MRNIHENDVTRMLPIIMLVSFFFGTATGITLMMYSMNKINKQMADGMIYNKYGTLVPCTEGREE